MDETRTSRFALDGSDADMADAAAEVLPIAIAMTVSVENGGSLVTNGTVGVSYEVLDGDGDQRVGLSDSVGSVTLELFVGDLVGLRDDLLTVKESRWVRSVRESVDVEL